MIIVLFDLTNNAGIGYSPFSDTHIVGSVCMCIYMYTHMSDISPQWLVQPPGTFLVHIIILWMEEIQHHHLDGWNHINSGINHLSTGAGFLPSTVSPAHLSQHLELKTQFEHFDSWELHLSMCLGCGTCSSWLYGSDHVQGRSPGPWINLEMVKTT